jgi:hypothetical protein
MEVLVMELTIPAYAKTISDALKSRHTRRMAPPSMSTPAPAPTQAPMPTPAPLAAPRAVQPERRPLGRLFRRETPSTFHRCLAVHMHYAQRASALD